MVGGNRARRRGVKRRFSGLAWAVVAAGLASGCADGLGPVATGMNWGHYLGAEDLRFVCDDGAPDRLRLIFKDADPPRLRLFEILEDQTAGGADVRGRVLTPADMAQIGVGDGYSDWRGSFASYRLSPLQFAVLIHKLEQSGIFDPPAFGGARPPNSARLLAGGCRAGGWFFNAVDDPKAAGELISFNRPPRKTAAPRPD